MHQENVFQHLFRRSSSSLGRRERRLDALQVGREPRVRGAALARGAAVGGRKEAFFGRTNFATYTYIGVLNH